MDIIKRMEPVWLALVVVGALNWLLVGLMISLAIHGAPSKGWGFDWFDKFIQTHALEHPFALMVQLVSMLFDGVFDRFPGLRVAYLEAGCAWVPFMMDRLDEEFERRGARWCPGRCSHPTRPARSAARWASEASANWNTLDGATMSPNRRPRSSVVMSPARNVSGASSSIRIDHGGSITARSRNAPRARGPSSRAPSASMPRS